MIVSFALLLFVYCLFRMTVIATCFLQDRVTLRIRKWERGLGGVVDAESVVI